MSDIKRKMTTFLPYDYQGAEKELNDMASQGWRLESIGFLNWTYKAATPNQYTYCITYVPDASDYNPELTEHQNTLDELCSYAGWRKVAEWNNMQIYETQESNPTPIDTDESILFDMMKRSVKKNTLPIKIALMLFFSLDLILALAYPLLTNEVRNDRPFFQLDLLMTAALVITEGVYIFNFIWWCHRSKVSLHSGNGLANCKIHDIIENINRVVFICFFVGYIFLRFSSNGAAELSLLCFFGFISIFFLINMYFIRKFFRYIGTPKVLNMILTAITSILLAFFAAMILTAWMMVRGILPRL